MNRRQVVAAGFACVTLSGIGSAALHAQTWMDTSLPPGQRAALLVAAMTNDEKIAILHGTGGDGIYPGIIPANTRLGIPALHLADGPAGPANTMYQVTALPAPITAAASWDVALMQRYALTAAQEEKGKGVNVHLAPTMNLLRVPQNGRAFEAYSEDPYLSARMAAAGVLGIEGQGIIATAKHYINNEQEYDRGTNSSDIDDRTQHEIYLPPFKAAVQAGAGAVMCGYNKINGVWACENGGTLNTWLKGELNFQGFVMSDWGATHTTAASANGGLDMEMPDARYFGPLATSIADGSVSQDRVNDMTKRILTSMFKAGLFDRAPSGSHGANVQSAAHTQTARDCGGPGSRPPQEHRCRPAHQYVDDPFDRRDRPGRRVEPHRGRAAAPPPSSLRT